MTYKLYSLKSVLLDWPFYYTTHRSTKVVSFYNGLSFTGKDNSSPKTTANRTILWTLSKGRYNSLPCWGCLTFILIPKEIWLNLWMFIFSTFEMCLWAPAVSPSARRPDINHQKQQEVEWDSNCCRFLQFLPVNFSLSSHQHWNSRESL